MTIKSADGIIEFVGPNKEDLFFTVEVYVEMTSAGSPSTRYDPPESPEFEIHDIFITGHQSDKSETISMTVSQFESIFGSEKLSELEEEAIEKFRLGD